MMFIAVRNDLLADETLPVFGATVIPQDEIS
jgi:hypothetical protein